MKPETIVRKMNEARKDLLKRIAWRILESGMVNEFNNFRHATWSSCQECVAVKQNAINAIHLVRSLR